jgi:hypothetical protein
MLFLWCKKNNSKLEIKIPVLFLIKSFLKKKEILRLTIPKLYLDKNNSCAIGARKTRTKTLTTFLSRSDES